ncbi:transglutaminase-like domain-containing protein [Candidatus Woesearchaeota archaeon]|nr:transglutaminase-like domain-containing protein [Candidatus Woesearchaeota archaeon]
MSKNILLITVCILVIINSVNSLEMTNDFSTVQSSEQQPDTLSLQTIYDNTFITYMVNISLDIEIVKLLPESSMEYVMATISTIPTSNYYQDIELISSNIDLTNTINNDQSGTFSQDIETAEQIKYYEEKPTGKKTLYLSYVVNRSTTNIPITTTIDYPLAVSSEEFKQYLEPVNANDFSELKQDEYLNQYIEQVREFGLDQDNTQIQNDDPSDNRLMDKKESDDNQKDLLTIVVNTQDLIFRTLDYEATLSSTSKTVEEILDNKYGSCIDHSILFVHTLRSLGIPARFVYGVVYDVSQKSAQKHVWAEVFFPGYGWLPFDPTTNSGPNLDLAHIKLKHYSKATEPLVTYSFVGDYVELKRSNPNVNVIPLNIGPKADPKIELSASLLNEQVGFNSYNLILSRLKNKQDQYLVTDIFIRPDKDVKLDKSKRQKMILKPNSTENMVWLFKTSEDSAYAIQVYTYEDQSVSLRLHASNQYANISPQQILDSKNTFEKYGTLSPLESLGIIIECSLNESRIYKYENTTMHCTINNSGNKQIQGQLCFDGCKQIALQPSDFRQYDFDLMVPFDTPEGIEYIMDGTVAIEGITQPLKGLVHVLKIPDIEISIENYPLMMYINSSEKVTFYLDYPEGNMVNNLTLEMRNNGKTFWEYSYGELTKRMEFAVPLDAKHLNEGNNTVELIINYNGDKGKPYTRKQSFPIHLKLGSIPDYIMYYQSNLMLVFDKLFYIAIGIVFFLLILGYILNPNTVDIGLRLRKQTVPKLFLDRLKHDEELIEGLERKIEHLTKANEEMDRKEKNIEKREKILEEFILKNVRYKN